MELKEPKVKTSVKQGHKTTEVGLIPEDWHLLQLKQISAFITKGSTPTTYGFKWEDSGVLFLRSECVGEHGLDLSQSMFISEPAHSLLRRSEIKDGDILLTITGNVGRVVLLNGVGRANMNQHISRIRITSADVDNGFIYHMLSQASSRRHFTSITTGQAYPQLSLKQVREALLPAPPSEAEQHAIATALSDVDGLIAGLESLLAKKRALKQGAMQQLLSGQKRLPGFKGEWGVKRLGEICELTAGTNKPISEMGSGALYVTVQDLYTGISISTERLGRMKMTASELEGRTLSAGDVVMGKSSVKREGIGYPSLFLGCDEPVVFSGFTFRVRAKKRAADSKFIFYALRWDKTRQWLIDNSQASALTNINRSIADRIPIQIPEVEEQIAIGQFLFDMDAELAAMEAKLGKTRLLKQGMMQELLTGKTRLA